MCHFAVLRPKMLFQVLSDSPRQGRGGPAGTDCYHQVSLRDHCRDDECAKIGHIRYVTQDLSIHAGFVDRYIDFTLIRRAEDEDGFGVPIKESLIERFG